MSIQNKYTNEQWINEAKLIHDKLRDSQNLPRYDYSKTNYIGSRLKVIITCPIHGDFKQRASAHIIQKQGCPCCGEIRKRINKSKKSSNWINEAKLIHDKLRDSQNLPRYDYSKTNYVKARLPVIITCPIHGDFKQIACNHLVGKGCRKCADIYTSNKITVSNQEFIKQAQQVHQNSDGTPRYDYSKTNYVKARLPVIITCPIHGDFKQTPNSHLSGSECPKCKYKINTKELEIQSFLKENNLSFEQSNRKILKPQELDIYIPEKQLAIEYNGLYWHSEIFKPTNYHLQKTLAAENKGIQLIHIFEDEWLDKRSIIEARLLNLLGKNKWSIGARKCRIKQVPVEEERIFLENNHLQGYVASTVCYGLYYFNVKNQKEYLIALMSFGPLRKNLGSSNQEGYYELYRFVTMKNFSVPGGASKLFKHFIKKFSPKQIISFADRRWSIRSEKNLYEQLGFRFDSYTEPGYFYIQGTKRINRFSLRKDVLIKEYGCPPSMSEHEFCQQQGWLRIYDVGQLKYIWK